MLSPEGKKIPTRGRGASRRKQEEAGDACGQSYSKKEYLIIGVYYGVLLPQVVVLASLD